MKNSYEIGELAYHSLKEEKVKVQAMAGQDPRGQLYTVTSLDSGKGYTVYGRDLEPVDE